MKKYACYLLSLLFLFLLCSCTPAAVYDADRQVRDFIAASTEGYTQLSSSSLIRLWDEEEGFSVRVLYGSDYVPTLRIYYARNRVTLDESDILQLTAKDKQGNLITYSNPTAFPEFFDSYQNRYISAVQVYQKENSFRILFFLIRQDDFYPFPQFLSQEMYDSLCKKTEIFTKEQNGIADQNGQDGTDYLAMVRASYDAVIADPRLTKQQGRTIYRYKDAGISPENLEILKKGVFFSPPYTTQQLRQLYQEYGYEDYSPDRVIVPVTLTVGEKISLEATVEQCYFSSAAQQNYTDFTLTLCPTLKNYDFIEVKQP